VSKQKLLLADDSVTIQKVVNLTFADEGIEVISVGDGDSAMEKILETSPDIILVDVNMPGLSGYEICERLRKSPAFLQTPVILLVGSFEPFDEEEAKRVGADDYLTKPFQSIRQLVQKVNTLLNQPKIADNTAENSEITAVESSSAVSSSVASSSVNEIPVILPSTPTVDEIQHTDTFDDAFDDEMIQTNRLKDDSELDISTQNEAVTESYTPIEHYTEIENNPYVPVEHENEIESKPYIPIEHDAEIESNPYVPIQNDEEIMPIRSEIDERIDDDEMKVEDSKFVPETTEIYATNGEGSSINNEVGLPEMASILTLDEQNPLEIAPREEDFIINMDHEQNSAADWDFMETRNFSTPAKNESFATEQEDSKYFDIIPTTNDSDQFGTSESSLAIDNQELPMNSTTKIEEEEDELVAKPTEAQEELVAETQDESVNETAEIQEEEFAAENTEPQEELVGAEPIASSQNVENNISVPNFIASTVVSEVAKEKVAISEELIEVIVNRVMERLSDNVVREIAWEIVPSHTDLIVKKMVQEKLDKD
jgi:CheY-like chemotaxis protein